MGGIFDKNNRPKLAGAYFNFQAEGAPVIPATPGAAVAIPFVHDWGPLDTVVRTTSEGAWRAIYGDSDDTDGYRAVHQTFQGEGVDGRGGAGEVVSYRFGGLAAAKATKVLQNTTPATALTLTARYHGTKGNQLKVTTQDLASDTSKTELILSLGSTIVEKYRFADSNITDLVSQINANSDWVTATLGVTGVALGTVSGSSLTGGDNGGTILAADWTGAMEAFEIHRFAAFLAYNLVETSPFAIQTAIASWTETQNSLGKRFFTVFGGGLAGEEISTAVTRSAALSSGNIINVGGGTITDLTLGSGQTSRACTMGEFAARVAGALVARGEYRSLTHARFAGVELTAGATLAELEEAFDGGVVALARDSHPTAPVIIKTGLTTWTSTDETDEMPYLIYRQPKYVRTIHGIETDLTQWAEENIIGQVAVNDATRTAVVGEVKARLLERQTRGAIQSGWTVGIDQDPLPSDDDEFIALTIGASFGRSLEQVYFTVSVG